MTTKAKKASKSASGSAGKAKPHATKAPAKPAKARAKAASASVKPSRSAKPAASKAKAKPAAKPTAKAAHAKAPAKLAEKKPVPAKAAPKAETKTEVKAGAKPQAKPQAAPTKPTQLRRSETATGSQRREVEAAKPQKVEAAAPAKAAPAKVTPAAAKVEPLKEEKKVPVKLAFKAKDFVVYPAHGVGQILDIEEQEVAGHRLELFVINFDKEKMTLRVPTHKAGSVGMRKLSDTNVVDSAIETLRGRARIKRTMWSRRAQEYEAKINSGDLISIAEVVRDLYRSERQPEQSYSERQLYEAALDRMAREVAVVERIGEDAAIQRVEAALQGGSGRGDKSGKATMEEPEAA